MRRARRRYRSPEQLAGELDATTDLYALGVTLVEALSWEPDWRRHQAAPEGALLSRVDVSSSLRELLGRLTAKKDLRFASASEALRELEASERAPLVQPRSRVWPVTIGTGAALLLFGAGVLTGRALPQAPHIKVEPRPPVPIKVTPCLDAEQPPSPHEPHPPRSLHHRRPLPPPPQAAPASLGQPGTLSGPVTQVEPGAEE
jgi:hypothetical protein